MTIKATLPCGCISGRVLCSEAQRLWDAVLEAAAVHDADWEDRRTEFKAHYAD